MNDNRSWICETLAHRQPSAVPYDFTFTPPVRARLEEHYGTKDVETTIGMPMRILGPDSVRPLYASPVEYGPQAADEFGVVWSTSPLDRGAPIGPCLHEPELANYRLPDPAAAYRFMHLGDALAASAGNFNLLAIGDLWEQAGFMRGMECLLLDVALNRRFVEELLRGLTDYVLGTMEIYFEKFPSDGVFLSDDYGTQRGMLISPRFT